MNAKHLAAAAVTAIGIGALGLGIGAGTASAAPVLNDPPCWTCGGGHGGWGGGDRGGWGGGGDRSGWGGGGDRSGWGGDRSQLGWDQRGIDDGRFDHQPFNWQGQRVDPYWDAGRNAWGFWFLGIWIPL
jgi:hypothetical protein